MSAIRLHVRCWLVVLALALIPSLAAAQAPTMFAPDSSPPARIELVGVAEVPMVESRVGSAAIPVVEVMVNGRGPFRFGIETGAGFVGVSRAFVDSLGLVRTGGPDFSPSFMIDSIAIGSAVFHQVVVTSLERPAMGVDGILGLPFYRELLLTLDYPAHRVRLERGGLPAANGKDILPIRHVGPFWAVPVSVEGKVQFGVIDTRSTAALSVSPTVGATFPFEGPLEVVGRARGAGIPETEVRAGKLAGTIQLGAYSIPHPFIAVRPLPPGFPEHLLVGSGVLQNFVLTLDQRQALIRLTRTGSTELELPVPQRRPGAPSAARRDSGAVSDSLRTRP